MKITIRRAEGVKRSLLSCPGRMRPLWFHLSWAMGRVNFLAYVVQIKEVEEL